MNPESPNVGKSHNTYGEAPQEWKEFFNTFANLRKKVLGKIFARDPDEGKVFLDRLQKKQEESFASVPDPYPYLAYHKSLASSIGPIDAPLLDFEGEHSLLKFYEELDKELGD